MSGLGGFIWPEGLRGFLLMVMPWALLPLLFSVWLLIMPVLH